MSYSKNYTWKFMQANSWHNKLFHFYLSFWIWKVWKGRGKITKNWISREQKELFRWNKKHSFTIFSQGVLFGEKIKIWQKMADKSFKTLCVNLLSGVTTIRTISQVFGKITISFEATKFGWLHYRNLEVFKTRALKYQKTIST